jgi:hypothetical protein
MDTCKCITRITIVMCAKVTLFAGRVSFYSSMLQIWSDTIRPQLLLKSALS